MQASSIGILVWALRNILVYRYLEISPAKLHDFSKRICEDVYERFMGWIKKIDPTI